MSSNSRHRRRSLNLASGSIALLVACVSGCDVDTAGIQFGNLTAGAPGTIAPSVGGASSNGGGASTSGGSGISTGGSTTSANVGGTNPSNGGAAFGGSVGNGGTAATIGGAAQGGAAQGAATGGKAQGGAAMGGAAQGGAATGGKAQGGAATGGAAQGGATTGGAAQGGAATGGRAQGGAAQGGAATGGKATGGASAGGAATGGKATGGAATGGSTGTSTVATQYVDATNAVRAAVTQPSNYTGTWVPLPNVTWSDTVAATAQAWADNLATTQNCGLVHATGTGYGENLAMGTNLTPQQAVTMWASEKNLYTWSPTYTTADFNLGSGHYTQLVWRTSIQIGCGSATCGTRVVIVCRYSPPGNYIGRAVY